MGGRDGMAPSHTIVNVNKGNKNPFKEALRLYNEGFKVAQTPDGKNYMILKSEHRHYNLVTFDKQVVRILKNLYEQT